jgi:hypothetical protein
MSAGDINQLFHINILQALTYSPPYKILRFVVPLVYSLSFAYYGRFQMAFCEFKNSNASNLKHKWRKTKVTGTQIYFGLTWWTCYLKVGVKVKLCFWTHWRLGRGIGWALCILNLGTRWWWVISIMPLWRKSCLYPLNSGLCGIQSRSRCFREQKTILWTWKNP